MAIRNRRKELVGQERQAEPGHPGTQLEMGDDPDHLIIHRPGHCGHQIEDGTVIARARRQVFDLVARMEVTEHQAMTVAYPDCHHATTAPFPNTVPPARKTFRPVQLTSGG